MVRGDRVDGIEYARRVNAAADLVGTGMPAIAAARTMAGRYGVSVRQARRYVEQAMAAGRVEVPEANVVFTVKLPGSLADQVREHARQRAPPCRRWWREHCRSSCGGMVWGSVRAHERPGGPAGGGLRPLRTSGPVGRVRDLGAAAPGPGPDQARRRRAA